MNDRIQRLANQAALFANLNSSSDINGPYYLNQYTDKLVELLVNDCESLIGAKSLYSMLIKNAWNPVSIEHTDESFK